MSLITFGTDLVDVCDVDIVATTGSTCMVYFQDGSYVASSLTAAAQAAAVNGTAEGALLTTVVTSTNFGTCYIAGQHVKRVRAAGADSIWDMCSGLGPVYVSGVDVTAAGVLIDATGECGGGGAPNAANAGTADGSSLTIGEQVNIASVGLNTLFWSFVPDEGSTTEGTVTLHVYGDAATTAPGAGEFNAVGLAAAGLPYPIDDTPFGVVQVTQAGAGAEVTMFGENDSLQFNVVGVDGSPIVFAVVLVYRTGAS